jgi:hypothetical protein
LTAHIHPIICSNRAGCIIVDYTVVIDDKENQTMVADAVVQTIINLDEDGSLDIVGKPVPVKPSSYIFGQSNPVSVK